MGHSNTLKNPRRPLSEVAISASASDWPGNRHRGKGGSSTQLIISQIFSSEIGRVSNAVCLASSGCSWPNIKCGRKGEVTLDKRCNQCVSDREEEDAIKDKEEARKRGKQSFPIR